MSNCTANGFVGRALDVDYPVSVNTIIPIGAVSARPSGTFGNDDALVIRFTTPSLGINDISVFQPAGYPPYQGTSRVYALAQVPCQFATTSPPAAPILYAISSQSPAITIRLTPCTVPPAYCGAYGAFLMPNTTYFITMVNRSTFGGVPSCASASCDMRIDFNR